MYRITKEFSFSAGHRLTGLPTDHQCSRPHGHNYVVRVELSCAAESLSGAGFVRDYHDLAPLGVWIDDTLDHRDLNEVLKDVNPTAENLARWIFVTWADEFAEMTAVAVSETPKTWAEFRGRGVG